MKNKLIVNIFLCFVILVNCGICCKGDSSSTPKSLYKEQNDAITVFKNNKDNKENILLTEEDVYLMAQVVYAESRSEPFLGKVAVASVILNRVKEPGFPKTIKGVIKQNGAFSCIKNNKINVVPDESSYKAVLQALKGNDPTNRAVFFYNPKIAKSKWMKNVNKSKVKTIGQHVFFVVE